MHNVVFGTERLPQGATRRGIAVAVAVALSFAGNASAQNIPYQAPQRFTTGTGVGQQPLQRGLVFEPRVEAAIQYASNINLAPDGTDKVDTAGLELSPGFYASYSSNDFIGVIDYSLIGRAWDESDYNDVSHRLGANGEWSAVPEWFSLRGLASYQDTVIDPLNGTSGGGIGIFNSGNLAEVASASVTPLLQHRFNDLELQARYSYGRTWYLDEGKGQPTTGFVFDQNSTDQAANVSFGLAPDTGSKISGKVFYTWEKSEYDTALPYKNERAGFDGGFQFARTLSFVGEIGKESDLDASTTQGGLDSDFWSAGLRYQPSDHTTLEGRYGNRFFGDSWSASVSHVARLFEFMASHSEEPTVETRALSLGDFDPGQLPPGPPPVDFGRINSSPYVAKNTTIGLRANGSRTMVGVSAYELDRNYLRVKRVDEKDTGVGLIVSRQLSSNSSADFDVNYTRYERSFDPENPTETQSADSHNVTTILRLNRRAGRTMTLSAEAGYQSNSTDVVEADGWWVGLRGRWSPKSTSEQR